MCPERSDKDNGQRTSTVQELAEPIPALFRVLTEEPDVLLRWTTYTYSAHFDLMGFKPEGVELDLELNKGKMWCDGLSNWSTLFLFSQFFSYFQIFDLLVSVNLFT